MEKRKPQGMSIPGVYTYSLQSKISIETKQITIGNIAIVHPINPKNRKKIEINDTVRLEANKALGNPKP